MPINGIVTKTAENEFLTDLILNPLDGARLKLFSNNVTITSDTVLADLNECTFSGYGVGTLTGWGAPAIQLDGSSASAPNEVSFTPTSAGGSGIIYGGYCTNNGGTKLLFAYNYATGGIVLAMGVSLKVTPTFSVLSRF